MNLFENFLDYKQRSSLMKICIGMEQEKSLIFKETSTYHVEIEGCKPNRGMDKC
jgi:hypothetical protein